MTGETGTIIVTTLIIAVGAIVIPWARAKEAAMPQCDECGPMYFGEHHPDCPRKGLPPDANYA